MLAVVEQQAIAVLAEFAAGTRDGFLRREKFDIAACQMMYQPVE
jgi:hypothetical protein